MTDNDISNVQLLSNKLNKLIFKKKITVFIISAETKIPYNVIIKILEGKVDPSNKYFKKLQDYVTNN